MKLAFILALVWGFCDARSQGKGNDFSFMNFARPLENQILIDVADILSQDIVQDGTMCALTCLKDAHCTSYNFGPVGDPQSTCERLRSSKFTPGTTLQNKPGFIHGSLSSPCERRPCSTGVQCIPQYENDAGYTCNCTGTGHIGEACDQTDCSSVLFDFENGVSGWYRTGSAFNNQPTYGDNSLARGTDTSNHKGDWWIGTFENRPSTGTPAGQAQKDGPTGTMTSPSFEIKGNTLSFLVAGSCNVDDCRVELLVDGVMVYKEAGKCIETLEQRYWNVSAYRGKTAQLHLVDGSTGGWAHINFDQLEYACP